MSDPTDRVGLQNLFESLCFNTKRYMVQPVDEKELYSIKKEVNAYLDKFVEAVGDQSDAIAFVEQHKNNIQKENKTNKEK